MNEKILKQIYKNVSERELEKLENRLSLQPDNVREYICDYLNDLDSIKKIENFKVTPDNYYWVVISQSFDTFKEFLEYYRENN